MRGTITIEGTDEFGAAHRSEIALEKDLNSLTAGAVGFSIEDGKTIMAHLQQVIVNQQCETYVLVRRFCMDCERFRRTKDFSKRKIRTVFGCVKVHPELPTLRAVFPRRLSSPAGFLSRPGDAGIDGPIGSPRQFDALPLNLMTRLEAKKKLGIPQMGDVARNGAAYPKEGPNRALPETTIGPLRALAHMRQRRQHGAADFN